MNNGVLGLIPAKGSSLRLAKKNILRLGEKPLLQWAIESALQSGVIDKLIVSSEDNEICEMAKKLGAEVPFIRPDFLSHDPHGVVEVALHALSEMRLQKFSFTELIILLPTCPFRLPSDIQSAYQQFKSVNAHFLMSVSPCTQTPFNLFKLNDNLLSPLFPEYLESKPGSLPQTYRPNGAIHILNIKAFEKAKSYSADPLFGYVMPSERSVDIDTKEDLIVAEHIFTHT